MKGNFRAVNTWMVCCYYANSAQSRSDRGGEWEREPHFLALGRQGCPRRQSPLKSIQIYEMMSYPCKVPALNTQHSLLCSCADRGRPTEGGVQPGRSPFPLALECGRWGWRHTGISASEASPTEQERGPCFLRPTRLVQRPQDNSFQADFIYFMKLRAWTQKWTELFPNRQSEGGSAAPPAPTGGAQPTPPSPPLAPLWEDPAAPPLVQRRGSTVLLSLLVFEPNHNSHLNCQTRS